MKQLILRQEAISLGTSLWLESDRVPVRVESVTVDDETHETEIVLKTVKDYPLMVENYIERFEYKGKE